MIKRQILKGLAFGLICCLSLGISVIKTNALSKTTPKYNMEIDYTIIETEGSGGGTTEKKKTGSGFNVVVQTGEYTNSYVTVNIYGDGYNGSGNLKKNSYINSNTVNIEINSKINMGSIKVTNSLGDILGNGDKSLKLSNLKDGVYNVSMYLGGGSWIVNSRLGKSVRVEATSTFKIDSNKPLGQLKNSSSGNNIIKEYTNDSFYYSSFDSFSGINRMELKAPNESSWKVYNGEKIRKEQKEGIYEFRCIDNAGNISDISKITLDTTPPTGTLYLDGKSIANSKIVKGEYISFSSINNTMYVKKPNSSTYTLYEEGTKFTKDGTYSFYCVDKALNKSSLYEVTLDNLPPQLICNESEFFSPYGGTFTVYTKDVEDKLYLRKEGEVEYTLSSKNSITILNTEKDGKYYFYAEDKLGNRSNIVWIELKITYPDVYVIKLKDGSKYVTWSDNSSKATLNGTPYEKNSIIKTEGDYEVKVTNASNRSKTINFKIEHNYIVIDKKDATCTEDGYTLYECTLCKKQYNGDIVKAKGHKYIKEIIEASCTSGGCTRYTCENCGDMYEEDKGEALGHTYIEEHIDATCTKDGGIKHTCTRCGHFYLTEKIGALGHDFESSIVSVPTCTKDGERHFKCKNCGDEYSTIIKALGHNYEIVETHTENGKTIRKYVCSACGHIYTQDMGEQLEKVSNYVETLFQKYSPYMIWVFLATSGVWSIAMGIAYIIAQKNDEKAKAKKMLINYGIGMIVIFSILVACPYLVKGIAYLVT